jgi:serine/threonine protein kinase
MTTIEQQARSIFLAILDRPTDRWAGFQDDACGGNAELRARVEELLNAHRLLGGVQGGASAEPTATAAVLSVPAGPGKIIGPYKVLEQIGEGGFGIVFVAEQSQPVRRKVALKILKPGMDSRQVVARFEAERQALALMDHPNIAKVHDAGTTAESRPYFVMELVKGVPITQYCDERRLTPRERLELFVPVCQAVQHAHQKGIIHRDLKPSNVLVARYDERPVPKVIDFGVAKATGGQLTEQTLNTGFGAVIGTPEYMSPEQANLNQLDVDTRSDVYALGVLLYELLAGSPPFSRKQLENVGMLEMLRVIREQEPSKPSTKLSTAQGLPALAANRGMEPARLPRLVRGELDWIVMKALEKDRNRRYESANALALDLQRYLAGEPVQAGPTSATYRLRRLARRHWRPLAVAAGFVGLLCAAVVGLASAVVVIDRERSQTRAALTAEQAAKARTREALDEMSSQVIEDWLAKQGDLTPEQRQFLDKALGFYEAFAAEEGTGVETRAGVAEAHLRAGTILVRLGRSPEALRAFERAEGDFRALAAGEAERKYRRGLALALRHRADELALLRTPAEADAVYAKAVAWFERLASEQPEEPGARADLIAALTAQAFHLRYTRRFAEALTIIERALPLQQQLAELFPKSVNHQLALADLWGSKEDVLPPEAHTDALVCMQRSLAIYERLARGSPPIVDAQRHAGRIRLNLADWHQSRFDDEAAVDETRHAEEWLGAARK